MRTYSAYYHEALPLGGNGLVLIKEKFNWFAFFLPMFWALRHQLWFALFTYIFISAILQAALGHIDMGWIVGATILMGFRFIFACSAPIFRHRKLLKGGYKELNPVIASDMEDAERTVLDRLVLSPHKTNEISPSFL